jgi:hypothetical protein
VSLGPTATSSGRAISPGKAPLILAAATIACLLPWINKAFCIDDPLFLWSAAQIQSHPLDFYGCDVNWYSTPQPLYDVMKNPPLACYYLAGAAALFGWSEPALHAAFLLPAIGAICGTWFLARSFCRDPLSAALVALVTPAFIVSSTNVMCDTTMLCFWTWAVALWVEGFRSGKSRWLGVASILMVAAALTKYFAISLIPLLGLYAVLYRRKPTWQLAWLLIPVGLLAGYQVWTRQQYGRGLLSDAAAFAWGIAAIPGPGEAFSQETVGSKLLVALSFTGGSFLPVLFCARWIWSKKALAAAASVGLALSIWARYFCSQAVLDELHKALPFTVASALQFGLFTICGALVLYLAISDIARRPSAEACLLTFWVFGVFGFAGIVNWTCNVRSLLPMAPAFGILVIRRMEERPQQWPDRLRWCWALAPAVAVAGMVAWADFCLANSARTAAAALADVLQPELGRHWFQGHWGFQYYMHARGGRELDAKTPQTRPGEVMVTPYNNTDVFFYSREFVVPFAELKFPACRWLATTQGQLGAGFYSGIWGPMPFAFGPTPLEKYEIARLRLEGHSSISFEGDIR